MNQTEYKLEDVDGLGEKTIPKLNALGIYTVMDLAFSGTAELVPILQKSSDWIYTKLIVQARQMVEINDDDIRSAFDLRDQEIDRKKIKTGVVELDNLLGGGIETRCITEFYGKYGSGKTQLCLSLSVLATLPESEGGLDGNVLYIDAEGTFRTLRLEEIANNRGLDSQQISKKVFKLRPQSAVVLESFVENISKIITSKNIKLIVVDSIIILHRQEYIGRELLSRRQQKLSTIMNKLLTTAEKYNIAVVITNQVSSDPGADPKFKEEVDHATGGNVIAHASTHRIYLERLSNRTKASMIDSPVLPKTECYFKVTAKGIERYVEKATKGKIPEIEVAE